MSSPTTELFGQLSTDPKNKRVKIFPTFSVYYRECFCCSLMQHFKRSIIALDNEGSLYALSHYLFLMWGSGLRAASAVLAGSVLRTSDQTGRGSLGDVPRDGLCRDVGSMCMCADGGLWEVLNHRHTAAEASDGSLRFSAEHTHTHTHTRTEIHGCKNILPCVAFCQIRHKVGHFCSTDLLWLKTNLSLSLTLFNTLTQGRASREQCI